MFTRSLNLFFVLLVAKTVQGEESSETKISQSLTTSTSSPDFSTAYLAVGVLLLITLFITSVSLYAADALVTSRIDSFLLDSLGPDLYSKYTSEYVANGVSDDYFDLYNDIETKSDQTSSPIGLKATTKERFYNSKVGGVIQAKEDVEIQRPQKEQGWLDWWVSSVRRVARMVRRRYGVFYGNMFSK